MSGTAECAAPAVGGGVDPMYQAPAFTRPCPLGIALPRRPSASPSRERCRQRVFYSSGCFIHAGVFSLRGRLEGAAAVYCKGPFTQPILPSPQAAACTAAAAHRQPCTSCRRASAVLMPYLHRDTTLQQQLVVGMGSGAARQRPASASAARQRWMVAHNPRDPDGNRRCGSSRHPTRDQRSR